MGDVKNRAIILWLSLPLAVLVTIASVIGLTTAGFYSAETLNWQAQSVGQDIVDLFLIIPALLISSYYAYRRHNGALLVWAGIIAFLVYTFTIYCFAVHFNALFIVYCLTLGLSFYAMAWFLLTILKNDLPGILFKKVPYRLTALYLVIIAIVFYVLWLAEIIPAILNQEVPPSIKEAGLFTNTVHVIDLSVFLPGVLITAIFLLRKKITGFIMAPVLLSFFVWMNLSIGGLVIYMKKAGVEQEYTVAVIMGVLALLSAGLLVVYIKRIAKNTLL